MIGIAHLPEKLAHLEHTDQLELRPCLSTNIGPEVKRELLRMVPQEAQQIVGNLVQSLKLVTSKFLPSIPIGGNVKFDDFGEIEDMIDQEALNHYEIDMQQFDEMNDDHIDQKKPLVGRTPLSNKIQAEGGSLHQASKDDLE